jgi:hypothetical protein
MGHFRIANGVSINEAADYAGINTNRSWGYAAEGGIDFFDTSLSDAECEAVYVNYVPSGKTDFEYRTPPPQAVQDARQTIKAFYEQNPSSITDTQAATLNRAMVIMLRWKFRELTESE